MREDGYKAIMVKEAVGDNFRAKAKAEGKTLTAFLEELMHGCNKKVTLNDTCNKDIMEMKRIVKEVREEVKMMREVMEGYRR